MRQCSMLSFIAATGTGKNLSVVVIRHDIQRVYVVVMKGDTFCRGNSGQTLRGSACRLQNHYKSTIEQGLANSAPLRAFTHNKSLHKPAEHALQSKRCSTPDLPYVLKSCHKSKKRAHGTCRVLQDRQTHRVHIYVYVCNVHLNSCTASEIENDLLASASSLREHTLRT